MSASDPPPSSGPAPRPWWRRRRAIPAVIAAAIALPLLLALLPGFGIVEGKVFDLLSLIRPDRPDQPAVVIVAIDEPALAEIGLQWPWPRSLHGRLVESLRAAGAAAIGLDILFAEPGDPKEDAALAAALGPDVVLAAERSVIEMPQGTETKEVVPLSALLASGARIGFAQVAMDPDAVLRRVAPQPDSFSRRLIAQAGRSLPAGTYQAGLLQSFGGPRTYPTVSYYQALDPENFLPPGYFRDRIVLVGVSLQNALTPGAGAADSFAVPSTVNTGALVAGVEIQATIVDNLLHGLLVRPGGEAARTLFLFAAAVLATLATLKPAGVLRGAVALALVVAAVALSWAGLRFGRVFVSPVQPVVAILFATGLNGARDFAEERRLRRFVSRAFAQYLSPALVERLAEDPSALRLGGARRTLTVLFCDLRDFTALSESMRDDPEGLTRLVNRVLDPLSEAVLVHGGTIDKYIGDCVMAFWNAPLDDPDHALNAVRAAMAMRAAIDRLNGELQAESPGAPKLAIGVGINTGACIVGNLGSRHRFDYSALGDAVNLASRLEGLSKRYGVPVVLGETTAAGVGDRLRLVELDRVAVKGRAEPVAIFTPLMGEVDAVALSAAETPFRASWQAGDWTEAAIALDGMVAAAPELAAFGMRMRARLAELAAEPPVGWTGVTVLDSK
ncbi:CHASE2 domain-containing protein [Segnochrobactraceae bacterium EtOH-i3]